MTELIRKCVRVGVSVLALALILAGCQKEAAPGASRELVVCSYGGAYQEAQRKAFFEPFEKETGIKIKEAEWSGEYAKLKAMVDSGQSSWDLVTAAEASAIVRGGQEGILERIDYTGLDKNQFYPEAISDYSVGIDFFATTMAYSHKDFPEGTPGPTSWRDFWDTKRFPGKRSLRNDPRTTLEFALLADGVPMDKLYPLDLDRAFKSLDKIKPSIGVWWTAGSQPPQLLADGEVKLTSAFNGRISTAAKRDHIPLAVEFNQGALDTDSWIIPKGAKNRDAALALIRYTSRPEVQIALTQFINYGPTVSKAYEGLSPEVRASLPSSPENRSRQFVFDRNWWAANESAVLERWTKWQLGK